MTRFAAGVVGYMAGGGAWQTTMSNTLGGDTTGWGDYFMRVVIPASELSISGNTVRVTLEAHSSTSLVVENCWIGHKAGSGNAWDFDGSQARVTFDSGNNGKTISGGTEAISDEISFSLDATTDVIIHLDFNSSAIRFDGSSPHDVYYKAGDDDGTDAPGGLAGPWGSDNSAHVTKIEVFA